MDFLRQVQNTIEQYHMLPEGTNVVAGVSGGADSVCLLYVLLQLQREGVFGGQIRAVHIHHGLRAAADEDEAFVRRLCGQWGVPLLVRHIDTAGYAREHGLGTEEAGHILRKEIFLAAAKEWEETLPAEGTPEQKSGEKNADGGAKGMVRIALAHHLEDIVETQIFQMARGSGIAGLGGIPAVAGRTIRPLAACTRQEIEEELRQKGIPWRTDESNEDPAYARNRIRHNILPELTRINKRALQHYAAISKESAEVNRYLEGQTRQALARCSIAPETPGICAVRIPDLMREDPLIRRRMLYTILTGCAGRRKDIGAVHVDILEKLAGSTGNGRADLPYGCHAVKEYDILRVAGPDAAGKEKIPEEALCFPCPVRADAYEERVFPYQHDAAQIPDNEYTKWFDYDRISVPLLFRTRAPGDRITITTDGHSKSLARFMIDEKIPASVRDHIVMPAAGEEILWVPGHRINARYKVSDKTTTILELHMKEEIWPRQFPY